MQECYAVSGGTHPLTLLSFWKNWIQEVAFLLKIHAVELKKKREKKDISRNSIKMILQKINFIWQTVISINHK